MGIDMVAYLFYAFHPLKSTKIWKKRAEWMKAYASCLVLAIDSTAVFRGFLSPGSQVFSSNNH